MEKQLLREMERDFMEERLAPWGWQLWNRAGPVLFSASHSVPQLREGRLKAGEYRSGVIARLCGQLSGCPVLCKTRNLGDDANFDPQNPYKTALLSLLRRGGIQLVLDLHISRASRPYDVDIGTGYGRNLLGHRAYLEMVRSGLTRLYPDVRVDDTFPAARSHTVSATAALLGGVPALQLEFNWGRLSTLSQTREAAQGLAQAMRPLLKGGGAQ